MLELVHVVMLELVHVVEQDVLECAECTCYSIPGSM